MKLRNALQSFITPASPAINNILKRNKLRFGSPNGKKMKLTLHLSFVILVHTHKYTGRQTHVHTHAHIYRLTKMER